MVKNLPTVERSTKIRFGKYATDDQAENTIVFNASNVAINANTPGSMYMTPLRVADFGGATFIGYNSESKEIVNTGVLTSLLGGITLESASLEGNTISNSIPHFANITTAFTTIHGSNVGISNTNPQHMLSVGDKIFMSNTGAEYLKVEGNVRVENLYAGSSISLNSTATNKILVFGKIKTTILESTDSIAINNTHTVSKLLSIGTHTFINTPSDTESAITTSGNITADFYNGYASVLTNLQSDNIYGKIIGSNTISASNIYSTDYFGNIVGSNTISGTVISGSDGFYGKIVGSNTISASNIYSTDYFGNIVGSNTISSSVVTVSGNITSQNITLTNTDITVSLTDGTLTIDAKEKTYGTAPLVVAESTISSLVYSNLITGAQIVVPILASGGVQEISATLTNVNFYTMTSDVSIAQDKHGLLTLSNLYGNIYMNAIAFS